VPFLDCAEIAILILKLEDSEDDMAQILADAWAGHP